MSVSFEDFKKVELKIGRVRAADRVPDSDKLIRLSVNFGEMSSDGAEQDRQVIAGIGKAYSPDALIGQDMLFITNLEPRTIMGLESQGMVLAASDENGPVVLVPERKVDPGSSLK